MSELPNPTRIIEVGLGFWSSKTLLSAIKLHLFDTLSSGPLPAESIMKILSLNPEGKYLYDFLDSLVALGFLKREGSGIHAQYGNTPETAAYLVKNSDGYLGAFFEMVNDREYQFWGTLEEGLQTGLPQNEIKLSGKESFAAIYEDVNRAEQFAYAMSGLQKPGFTLFANLFDASQHQVLLDVGGSAGIFSCLMAQHNPDLHCLSFDLKEIEPYSTRTIEQLQLENQVEVVSGDFFSQEFPPADLISMNNIINSFNLEKKKFLLKKCFDALPDHGKLIIVELFVDDQRKGHPLPLLMSLNMLIESDGGFAYSHKQLIAWANEIGFHQVEFMDLNLPVQAAILYK